MICLCLYEGDFDSTFQSNLKEISFYSVNIKPLHKQHNGYMKGNKYIKKKTSILSNCERKTDVKGEMRCLMICMVILNLTQLGTLTVRIGRCYGEAVSCSKMNEKQITALWHKHIQFPGQQSLSESYNWVPCHHCF